MTLGAPGTSPQSRVPSHCRRHKKWSNTRGPKMPFSFLSFPSFKESIRKRKTICVYMMLDFGIFPLEGGLQKGPTRKHPLYPLWNHPSLARRPTTAHVTRSKAKRLSRGHYGPIIYQESEFLACIHAQHPHKEHIE